MTKQTTIVVILDKSRINVRRVVTEINYATLYFPVHQLRFIVTVIHRRLLSASVLDDSSNGKFIVYKIKI